MNIPEGHKKTIRFIPRPKYFSPLEFGNSTEYLLTRHEKPALSTLPRKKYQKMVLYKFLKFERVSLLSWETIIFYWFVFLTFFRRHDKDVLFRDETTMQNDFKRVKSKQWMRTALSTPRFLN
jgi:hypothetical protein